MEKRYCLRRRRSNKHNTTPDFDAILRAFAQTNVYQNGDTLMPEVDCKLEAVGRIRRPDIACFTAEQKARTRFTSEIPVPHFVIEVISTHDHGTALEEKLDNYFRSGVQVVWYVYANLEIVRVYTSLDYGLHHAHDDLCTAAPVAPEFSMTVNQIFAR